MVLPASTDPRICSGYAPSAPKPKAAKLGQLPPAAASKRPQATASPHDLSSAEGRLARFLAQAPVEVVAPCLSHLDAPRLEIILGVPRLRQELDAQRPTKDGSYGGTSFQMALQGACRASYGAGAQGSHPSQQSYWVNARPHEVLLRKLSAQRMLEAHIETLWQKQLTLNAETPMRCNVGELALGQALRLLADATPHQALPAGWPQMPHGPAIPEGFGPKTRQAWRARAAEAMLFLNLAGPRHRGHYLGEVATGAALVLLGQEDRGVPLLRKAWKTAYFTAFGTMSEPDSNDAFDLDGPACRWHKARYTTAGRHPLADFLLETALRAGSSQAFEHVANIGKAVPELAAYPIVKIGDAQDAIDAGHPQLLALLLVRLRASLDLNTWQKLHQRALAARQRLHGTDSEALSAADACLESLAQARRAVRATSMHFELMCALVETGLSYQEAQQAFGVFAEVAADASDAGAQLEAFLKQLTLPQAEVLRQFCQKL